MKRLKLLRNLAMRQVASVAQVGKDTAQKPVGDLDRLCAGDRVLGLEIWDRFLPTRASLLAEMVPTWRTFSLEPLIGVAMRSRLFSVAWAPSCSPRFSSAGAQPAVIARRPRVNRASVSRVAVVVPSPATSLVLLATSLTSCAPMCS